MIEETKPLPVGLKRDGTPQKRANQWTKRKEVSGLIPEKDKVEHRAHIAAAKLEACMNGKVELSQTQMQAAKALMDKGIASRQAIETTSLEPAALITKDQEEAILRSLIAQRPDLVQQILAEQARSAGGTQLQVA
jgi:hypothetical protein